MSGACTHSHTSYYMQLTIFLYTVFGNKVHLKKRESSRNSLFTPSFKTTRMTTTNKKHYILSTRLKKKQLKKIIK